MISSGLVPSKDRTVWSAGQQQVLSYRHASAEVSASSLNNFSTLNKLFLKTVSTQHKSRIKWKTTQYLCFQASTHPHVLKGL